MFAKWWKLTTKKTRGYIINTYFQIFKFFDKVYDNLKDCLRICKINLMLKMFYGLMLKLLKLFLKIYSVIVAFFFFQICDLKILAKLLLFAFFFELHYFSRKKPPKNHQVMKFFHQMSFIENVG
jgi:chromate transport protein ChrA